MTDVAALAPGHRSRASARPATETPVMRAVADRDRRRLPGVLPACCRSPSSSSRRFSEGFGAFFAGITERDARRRDRADADRRGDLGAGQPGLRACRVMGDRQVRVQGQEPADHPDRPAVLGLAGDLRPDLCAPLRRAGLFRPVAAGARHPDHLRRARHRARHDLRHLSLHRARADPDHAGAGHAGRGGGAVARRDRLADFLPRHAAEREMGAALRRASLQRARHGRVRRGLGRLRKDPRQDQHHAAAGGNSLQRVHADRGVRARGAACAACPRDSSDQVGA